MMKFFTGWFLAAGLTLATTAAQAQVPAPYEAGRSPYYPVSDIGGPYVGGPYAPPPREYPGLRYGQGPMLLPPTEVYTVVRESGFSPLGIPQQRGFVYTISVIDRGGDDGRLIIDARTGRIIRFIP
ncbi:MAG: PepSY domain-containing protein, partial [Bradyrhizobium sp.]|nr:PepSY domain-containing protein [Bradyrhizobium sp.]